MEPDASVPPAVLDQTNKRLTLNLLIQGAACHTYISASHLVRDELEECSPGLTLLYNRFALCAQLNYCIGDNALLSGRPHRWWGFSRTPQAPFVRHNLMARYGSMLAREELRHLRKLARTKDVLTIPFAQWVHLIALLMDVSAVEKGKRVLLQRLAKQVAAGIWGIPEDRLSATLTEYVSFGNLQTPATWVGKVYRRGAIGYGGVERVNGQMQVVARAWVFPLLVHELVKGTAELICLHGLGGLEDSTYAAVTGEADRIEYEPWLMQAGPAMWRRLLAVAPRGVELPHTLMQLAMLEPQRLDALMITVIEQPEEARRQLVELTG